MKRSVAVITLCVILFGGCAKRASTLYVNSDPPDGIEEAEEESSSSEDRSGIVVYICGAVKEPGVYELPAGSRVKDAVEAAGGMNEAADPTLTNQARLLSDGEQILVHERAKEGAAGPSANMQGIVNINQAGAEELTGLPGIGPSKAEAILAYREENGFFQNIEEITNVTGIGPSLFERIREKITVG